MAQENNTDVKNTEVTVTTTPKLAVSASATAKLAATAETSTAFNVKTTTSLVALDAYSIGGVGLQTSKKVGATVTYQCGKNGNNFSTSHKNKSYAYTKSLTFSYVNGMAMRGTTINIVNKTDMAGGAKAALALMSLGTVTAPVVAFGVNSAGRKNGWETSAEKKKRKDAEKLQQTQDQADALQDSIDNEKKEIAELESKENTGTLTPAERIALDKLKDQLVNDQNDLADKQKTLDDAAAKKKKKDETKADIGGDPDTKQSQSVTKISDMAGTGVSAVASIGTAIAAAATIVGGGFNKDKGILIGTKNGDFVMNATQGTSPEFCVNALDNPVVGGEPKASLKITHLLNQKKAEFNAVNNFLAKSGQTSMTCTEDSVTLKHTANSTMTVKDQNIALKFGANTMKITASNIDISVGAVSVKVEREKMTIAGVNVQ